MYCVHCLSKDPRQREQRKVRLHAWPLALNSSPHGSKLQFAPDLFLSHLTPGWPHLDFANQADNRNTCVCSCFPTCFPCPFVGFPLFCCGLSFLFCLFLVPYLVGWIFLFVLSRASRLITSISLNRKSVTHSPPHVQRQQAVFFHTFTPTLPTFPTLIWLRPQGAKPDDRTPPLACDLQSPSILPRTRRLALIPSPLSETRVLPTPAVWQARLYFCQEELAQASTGCYSISHPHL